MKEHPILFQGPMVRAILEGRKTQTRRVVKPQPTGTSSAPRDHIHVGIPDGYEDDGETCFAWQTSGWSAKSPYGAPGDRLWVRERWRVGAWDETDGSVALDFKADNSSPRGWIDIPESADPDGEVFQRLWHQSTDDAIKAGKEENEEGRYHWPVGESPCRWRPSIHMPRWASRITLEVTAVRVERLQDISRGDAMGEGCTFPNMADGDDPRKWYAELWDSINGIGSWQSNPWVWVVEFKRIP